MAVRAVRGAIQIDDNAEKFIDDGVIRLVGKIIEENKIDINNIISIIFSQTKDITAKNPAAALRKIGFNDTPLFCTKEPDVIGSMERVVRVLITTETERDLKPVYLKGAKKLRMDISN
jgi:chorismate mutase